MTQAPGTHRLSTLLEDMDPPVGAHRVAVQDRSRRRLAHVLRVAGELVDQSGPSAATTKAIADSAGVSVGWMYRFFEDRESVFEEICLGGLRGYDTRLEAIGFSLDEHWRSSVHAAIDAVGDVVRDNPGFRTLWFSPAFSTRMVALNREHDHRLAQYLAGTMTGIRPDAPRVPPITVAKVVVGLIDKCFEDGYALSPEGNPSVIAEFTRAIERYLEVFLDGPQRPAVDKPTRAGAAAADPVSRS